MRVQSAHTGIGEYHNWAPSLGCAIVQESATLTHFGTGRNKQ